ncbi:LexA family transcriptional regulator [uncultured Solobacterium sp.]|uniref:LexA family protein n=1 Tax=uncultured Solobacterium sp. TaxID=747375 RepID=UPI0026001B53|nr:XRE family transcriptional regulator [uncultured Solobacterium sp.]
MKNTGEMIKYYRKKLGLTQEELGNYVGVQKSAIAKYENGRIENLKRTTIEKLSELFGILPSELLGISATNNIMTNKTNVIGIVPAGTPLEAIEDIIGEIEYPSRFTNKQVFALQIKGDSMNKVLPDGCIGLFEKTSTLENGEIGAIMVNGDDATVKKFYRLTDSYVLEPVSFNPEQHPLIIKDGTVPVHAIGRLIWYCSKESII